MMGTGVRRFLHTRTASNPLFTVEGYDVLYEHAGGLENWRR
jgi:hypothetical protein